MATILVVDDSNLSWKTCRILERAAPRHRRRWIVALNAGSTRVGSARRDHVRGRLCARQLRMLDPDARVVMATADVQNSTRELAMEGGAIAFVTKPLVTDVVLQAVAAALEGATS